MPHDNHAFFPSWIHVLSHYFNAIHLVNMPLKLGFCNFILVLEIRMKDIYFAFRITENKIVVWESSWTDLHWMLIFFDKLVVENIDDR